ncbi:hypothetical protein R3P38DRAFT_3115988 [Favolaschia claudopus]|uniref:Uncharacterized protein n=1 Tax=Favolaschia claudopus TaxID=2862362 RepID=A0AAV9ZFG7_9AGAR
MPRVTSLVFSLFLASFIAAAPVVPVEVASYSLSAVTAEVAAVSEINLVGVAVHEIHSEYAKKKLICTLNLDFDNSFSLQISSTEKTRRRSFRRRHP